ncbi:hypothetical protein F4778DRAFT_60285 [Xylariomycetidae sp. FL2044]|nr:hypothetical protein F4778DRAFT_60285 [Xylariomycetidae sp. FL2044]
MAEVTSPKSTPKRKRDDLTSEQRLSTSPSTNHWSRTTFTFQPSITLYPAAQSTELIEDGSSSPRTKVAQKFQDLALENRSGSTSESGGGVDQDTTNRQSQMNHPRFSPELNVFGFDGGSRSSRTSRTLDGEMQLDDDDDDTTTRKRTKLPETDNRQGQSSVPSGETSADAVGPVQIDNSGHLTIRERVDPAMVRVAKSGGNGYLKKSYPSINRLADSKSRSRRRAGTPPISSRRKWSGDSTSDEEPVVIDPVRAALTWHDDEITVYDPEDKDDDGTGINGIGFKPTPAMAFARAQKRKQQLAEYRKREDSEARAKRNLRRREQLGGGAEMERKHSMIRVHFSEAEPTTVITT